MRWRLSCVFEVDLQFSRLNFRDVIGVNVTCPIVGGRENEGVVGESPEGFPQGNEDFLGMDAMFTIP